jgi:hypothetical protein
MLDIGSDNVRSLLGEIGMYLVVPLLLFLRDYGSVKGLKFVQLVSPSEMNGIKDVVVELAQLLGKVNFATTSLGQNKLCHAPISSGRYVLSFLPLPLSYGSSISPSPSRQRRERGGLKGV